MVSSLKFAMLGLCVWHFSSNPAVGSQLFFLRGSCILRFAKIKQIKSYSVKRPGTFYKLRARSANTKTLKSTTLTASGNFAVISLNSCGPLDTNAYGTSGFIVSRSSGFHFPVCSERHLEIIGQIPEFLRNSGITVEYSYLPNWLLHQFEKRQRITHRRLP